MQSDYSTGRWGYRGFLWIALLGWAIALGAKIYDLLVLGCAWGAAPPKSLDLLPYGRAYPIDPGNFFQPLSGVILIGAVGSLLGGWKTPARRLLLVSLGSLVVIWIFTPTVFWPMIVQMWEVHRGRLPMPEAEVIALVRRWFIWDSFRIVAIAVGFIASVRAYARTAPASDPARSR